MDSRWTYTLSISCIPLIARNLPGLKAKLLGFFLLNMLFLHAPQSWAFISFWCGGSSPPITLWNWDSSHSTAQSAFSLSCFSLAQGSHGIPLRRHPLLLTTEAVDWGTESWLPHMLLLPQTSAGVACSIRIQLLILIQAQGHTTRRRLH